jgi:hypothetical protein
MFETADDTNKGISELGKDYIARNLEDLECQGNDFESGYYRAFILDDAFSRLNKFLEYDYNTAMEQNSKAYKDDRIRCLKTQSKAFYTCHPCVNVKKRVSRMYYRSQSCAPVH